MAGRGGHVPVRLVAAVAIAIAWPYAQRAWQCRAGLEATEACVWGKAFFPLTRWVAPLIVAPIAYAALTAAAHLWRRMRRR